MAQLRTRHVPMNAPVAYQGGLWMCRLCSAHVHVDVVANNEARYASGGRR